jgi:hypothetical protein
MEAGGHGDRTVPWAGFAVAVAGSNCPPRGGLRAGQLGEPQAIEGRRLPPSLREFEPLGNDLLPAALDLRPELGDWMSALAARWERMVLLTGSGPAVFAFFADADEASGAAAVVDGGRAVWAGETVGEGIRVVEP